MRHIKESMSHIKDCELGNNWKQCPACVDQHNSTCPSREVLPIPEASSDKDECKAESSLSCPFCGAIPESFDGDWVIRHSKQCFLYSCGFGEHYLVSPQAIAEWNTRKVKIVEEETQPIPSPSSLDQVSIGLTTLWRVEADSIMVQLDYVNSRPDAPMREVNTLRRCATQLEAAAKSSGLDAVLHMAYNEKGK
jgi:hypothetical protein